jgi:hypothetical protein
MSTIELEMLKANLRLVTSPSLNELLLEITNNFVVQITINRDGKNERASTGLYLLRQIDLIKTI